MTGRRTKLRSTSLSFAVVTTTFACSTTKPMGGTSSESTLSEGEIVLRDRLGSTARIRTATERAGGVSASGARLEVTTSRRSYLSYGTSSWLYSEGRK